MTQAISGHGCLIARALSTTPTVFVAIAELGDISLPELQRNEFIQRQPLPREFYVRQFLGKMDHADGVCLGGQG